MIRDEIIKSLERCTHGGSCNDCICFSDQVESGGDIIACMDALMNKALVLLKNETIVQCDECKYAGFIGDCLLAIGPQLGGCLQGKRRQDQ